MDKSNPPLEDTQATGSWIPESLVSKININNSKDTRKSPKKPSQNLAQQLTAQLTGRGHLITSQQTIEKLQRENLDLKLKLSNLKKRSTDQDRQMAELLALNRSLEKQLKEREREKKTATKESSCQTNLDSLNMDEFMRARVSLRRIVESQSMQAPPSAPLQPPPPQQSQQPIITELNYPNVTRPKMVINEDLHPDEKNILDRLYYVLGLNINSLDRLKSKQTY